MPKKPKGKWIETDSSRVKLWLGTSADLEFEKRAATAFALMFNTLDPLAFVPLLGAKVRYSNQNILTDLKDKKAVVEYILPKLKTIEQGLPETRVFAELGEFQDRPCVLMAQGTKEPPLVVVLFEVDNKSVTSVAYCTAVPHPSQAKRLGVYPGADA